MKAKCPIVPVALIDTYKAFDTGSAEPLTVQVHFLKPMHYEEYKDMKSTEIAAEVRKRVEATIQDKIAGQPGVKLPAVFCIRMSRSSGIFLIEGLLHECAIFTELTVSVFAA